jgi:CheY-like chemotaxis protein
MPENQPKDWMLVVDDQNDQWTILRGSLQRILPQVPTSRVPNVITALSQLQACLLEKRPLPRLILTDLYLPQREDGFHLVAALKSPASGLAHLPVVVMSSSKEMVDQQITTRYGVAYLVKPQYVEESEAFLARLKRHWDQSDTNRLA